MIDFLAGLWVGLFGGHVHEWGLWEPKWADKAAYDRTTGKRLYGFVQYYQQRRCKTCGELEQKEMEHPLDV